jgi:expansin (peptidoglycan-binding protein)
MASFPPRRPVLVAAVSAVLAVAVTVGLLAGLRGGSGPAAPRTVQVAGAGPAGEPARADGATATGTAARTAAPRPRVPAAAALGPLRVPARAGRAAAGGRSPVAPGRTPDAAGGAPAAAGGVPAGPARSGRATHYTLAGLPNCSFPTPPADGRFVAVGPAEYAGAAACGSVLDVHGPRGTVRVTVIDQCPECEPGHLDLAVPAFAALADPVQGIVPVTYTRVLDPPLAGPVRVRVKEGSSANWLSVLFLDTGNQLVTVEAAVGSSWVRLVHQPYNYWEAASGVGAGPVTLRITDDRGHRRTLTGIPVAAGTIHPTSVRMY